MDREKDPLGFAENHTAEAKAKKLDKKCIASLMQQVTNSTVAHNKSMKWTPEAKLEHIRERWKRLSHCKRIKRAKSEINDGQVQNEGYP